MASTQQSSAPVDLSARSSLVDRLFGSLVANDRALQVVWTIVRVGVGGLMIHNGLDKLADVPGFATGVVAFLGFPYPAFFTYCAAYTEIVASVLLIAGALTRVSAGLLLATMSVAIAFHLKKTGTQVPALEMASLYAMSFLLFVVGGGGAWSIDTLIQRSRRG